MNSRNTKIGRLHVEGHRVVLERAAVAVAHQVVDEARRSWRHRRRRRRATARPWWTRGPRTARRRLARRPSNQLDRHVGSGTGSRARSRRQPSGAGRCRARGLDGRRWAAALTAAPDAHARMGAWPRKWRVPARIETERLSLRCYEPADAEAMDDGDPRESRPPLSVHGVGSTRAHRDRAPRAGSSKVHRRLQGGNRGVHAGHLHSRTASSSAARASTCATTRTTSRSGTGSRENTQGQGLMTEAAGRAHACGAAVRRLALRGDLLRSRQHALEARRAAAARATTGSRRPSVDGATHDCQWRRDVAGPAIPRLARERRAAPAALRRHRIARSHGPREPCAGS